MVSLNFKHSRFVYTVSQWFKYSFFFVYAQLNDQTILFQTIQFSIITQLSSIRHIDRTLSGATAPGQSEPGSDSKEGVLEAISLQKPQEDCLVSYQGHLL